MPLDVGDIAKDIHEALDYVERNVQSGDKNRRARYAWAYLAGTLRARGNFGDEEAGRLARRIRDFMGIESADARAKAR